MKYTQLVPHTSSFKKRQKPHKNTNKAYLEASQNVCYLKRSTIILLPKPQLPSLSSLLQNEAYHLSTHSYNFLHIKNLLSIKHSLLLFANSWFINQLIINLVSSFTSRYIFLFFPNVGIPIIHEMGFVKYYKISKNFQNPHSKIKNFIHTSKIQRYPPTNIKKVLIFWGFAYTCWEMDSWATL